MFHLPVLQHQPYLPVVEKIAKESVDSFLEVQVSVDVKVPHLLRHLDVEVEHAGGRPKHNLRGGPVRPDGGGAKNYGGELWRERHVWMVRVDNTYTTWAERDFFWGRQILELGHYSSIGRSRALLCRSPGSGQPAS